MVKKLRLRESTDNVILSNDLFELVSESGTTVLDVPWQGLDVRSKGLAKKCVVEIRLDSNWFRAEKEAEQNGTDITVKYYGAKVGWGMSSMPIDVDDMIYCLQEAKKFAERIERELDRLGLRA